MLRGKRVASWAAAAGFVLGSATVCMASGWPVRSSSPAPVPVVLLSDPHFDPFQDPSRFPALRTASVAEWERVLMSPPSSRQAAEYAALQKTCKARGSDSSWDVLHASLRAASAQQPAPLFVTVSGDLLTHNFDCRMRTLDPAVTAEELSAFAEKTVAFVALQVRQAFPHVPVYIALGNNDSGCSNYHQSRDSEFVRGVSQTFESDLSTKRDHRSVVAEDEQGDYTVALPSPMKQARLIVLQDVFESVDYGDCGGTKTEEGALAQIAWLRGQLSVARANHQHVWVMAHIPPGIDAYASFHKYIPTPEKLCSTTTVTPMLKSEALNDALTEYSDVVRLAVFAHTHMDEIKLLHNDAGNTVAAKLVPSISPVNGNHSAFTVAQVQPQTALLLDYAVYVAGDKITAPWGEEYRYSTTYKAPDFSADSVGKLAYSFAKDKQGTGEASLLYEKWFFPGDNGDYAAGLRKIWPSYACGTVEDGGPAFRQCMCPAEEPSRPAAPSK